MFKKIGDFLLGLFLFVGTLFVLFFSYGVVEKWPKEPPKDFKYYQTVVRGDLEIIPDFSSYFLFPPLQTTRVVKFHEGGVLYDVTYEIDRWGFRRLDHKDPEKAREHLAIGGCSFSFGEGLPNEHTFPFMLEEALIDVNAYNFSVMGGGVNTLLSYFEKVPTNKIIKETKGKFVYVFMDNHLSRWLARPDYLSWANQNSYHYKVEGGKVVNKGKLKDQSFFQQYKKLSKMGLSPTLLHTTQTLSDTNEYSDEEIFEFLTGVKALQDQYLSYFPEGEFYFFIYPVGPELLYERMYKFAKEKGFKVLFPKQEFYYHSVTTGLTKEDFFIPYDFHPNEKANEYISYYLQKTLFKKGH